MFKNIMPAFYCWVLDSKIVLSIFFISDLMSSSRKTGNYLSFFII